MNIPFQYTSQAEDLSKHMNRALLENNVGNSNNIETPVQLLILMKNFTVHPTLFYLIVQHIPVLGQ